jgi:hypothetical protein
MSTTVMKNPYVTVGNSPVVFYFRNDNKDTLFRLEITKRSVTLFRKGKKEGHRVNIGELEKMFAEHEASKANPRKRPRHIRK